MTLKERLRHHVTGAIERGEAEAVAGIPLPTIGEKLQSIKHDKQASADFIAKSNPDLVCAAPDLLEALRALEFRITKAARAFYEGGKASLLRDALAGWKDEIEQSRDAIAKAEGH